MSREHDTPMPRGLLSSLQNGRLDEHQLERLWRLLGDAGQRELVTSTDEAWTEIASRVEADTPVGPSATDRPPIARRRNGRSRSVRRAAAAVVAASVLAMLAAGFWWMYGPATLEAPAGAQQTVSLPDGTTVELNSATTIRFARLNLPLPMAGFQTRRVVLDGEAYFRVVPGADPFVVETPEARVDVLGTEFNVRTRQGLGEDGTVVTLATGVVRLTPRGRVVEPLVLADSGASARITRAGESIRLRTAMPLDHVLAWRRNGFAVVNQPLQAVFDEVERRYAIEIAPRHGIDQGISMTFFYPRGAAPEQILSDICLAQACTYRETSQGFALSARDTTSAGAIPVKSAAVWTAARSD